MRSGTTGLLVGLLIGVGGVALWLRFTQPEPVVGEPAPTTSMATSSVPELGVVTSSTSTSTTRPTTTELIEPGVIHVSVDGIDSRNGQSESQSVRTAEAALALVEPGGEVRFHPGVYPPLQVIGVNGLGGAPITFRSAVPGMAEFSDGGRYDEQAAVQVTDSSHVVIDGLTARSALWGISVRGSEQIVVRDNHVYDIGQEGIHIRDFSSYVEVLDNVVHNTGNRPDAVSVYPAGQAPGEGIYLGTGRPSNEDETHHIVVAGNEVFDTNHEALDIKAPVHHVLVENNYFHDINTYVSGAVVIHLGYHETVEPEIVFRNNVIDGVTRTSEFRDGNCLVLSTAVHVYNNVFANCQHRGVYLRVGFKTDTNRDVRLEHNTFFNAGEVAPYEVEQGSRVELVSRNNLGVGTDGNRVLEEGDLVDPANGDFRLSDSSGAGTGAQVIDDVPVDFTGAARMDDPGFGAFE